MLKLTTGRSWRATTSTSRPFLSCQRSTLGKLSSAGTGGGGALMRSVRFFQKSGIGAAAPGAAAADAPGGGDFSAGSYWTSMAEGLPAGFAAGAGVLAQLASVSKSENADADAD